jgi:hypothetical protein
MQNCCPVNLEWAASDLASFELGASHAGPYALNNKVALQFGDGSNDDHDGAPERPAGINVLPEADEIRPEADSVHPVFPRSGELSAP